MDARYAGRYEVRQLLGRGGAGSVYSGWDPLIGRPVAVKIIPLGEVAGHDAMQWILREAQAAGVLSHPHIVTVFDIGTADDYAWIVMELVSGGSLADAVRDETLQTDQSLRVLSQIASALDDAHRNGITHRDVKPGNVLLKEDGTAKIGDFGVARIQHASKLTKTGHFVGTPQYMSPEQLQAKSVDGRADQFSLAVMAYEMLAGRPPFTGEGLIFQLLTADPPPFDPRLDPVFRKALAKKPEERYANCSGFVQAIGSALTAEAPAPPPPARWKFVATMAGIFGVVILAFGGARILLNSALDREAHKPDPPAASAPTEVLVAEPVQTAPATPPPVEQKKSQPKKAVETSRPEPANLVPTAVSGTAIWSGRLPAGEVLTIEQTHCSAGQVTRELPGVPIDVRVTPSYVEVLEAPAESNGWKKIRLVSKREIDTIVINYQTRS